MTDQQQSALLPQLRSLLPLDDGELRQILTYTDSLPDGQAMGHLMNLLGDSPEALEFVSSYTKRRGASQGGEAVPAPGSNDAAETTAPPPSFAPPPGPPPSHSTNEKANLASAQPPPADPPAYQSVSQPPTPSATSANYNHTNEVVLASRRRAVDEQVMQQRLQNLQYQYRIYNSELEPEHESDYYCSCPIHIYQQQKWNRIGIQEQWSKAVMYPGEKFYSDAPNLGLINNNPYQLRMASPYGYGWNQSYYGPKRPIPSYHASWVQHLIALNNQFNAEAQRKVDAREPKSNIWEEDTLSSQMGDMKLGDKKTDEKRSEKGSTVTPTESKRLSRPALPKEKSSKMSGFRKAIGIKSSEEKADEQADYLRTAILKEESGRWPDEQVRMIVRTYMEKIGMSKIVAALRAQKPLQYLHLLKAGYFEPIPVAWAYQASNPMKFSIEAVGGWRGITPAWRGYEDLAEERLYWVLNHREGSVGTRLKPDFISELNMARARMASAVEPPPLYYSSDDTCRVQHTSDGTYTKQVLSPFRPYDRPEQPTDDTMILLDVSGSMDFEPVRPVYDQYLITSYTKSTQPKNKDVAKAIVRRFTDAMENHDHQFGGYDLVTFANQSQYIGRVHHKNLEQSWRSVRFGGGTRVMTGWQKVKELHFQKHAQSAIHHPVFGWQAGPDTPMLRLLLLLDGEATDMDEFELDLLSLNWAHITVFLIGIDGCPHHHRHANELQRISDVNHHVSFVDAQGNFPERFVTHELLKRHLGYDISMREFEQMEELPAYTAVA